MARMFPENIEGYEGATEGERGVFRFLKEAARPQRDFLCWYEPPIGGSGKEPDFILLGASTGLLVLEVKDWTSRQIVSYNPHRFTVLISGKEEKKTNPDRQAKGYVNALMERLKAEPEFVSSDHRHGGGLKIPVGRMVVYPNISKSEYSESNLKWVIDSERALFREDLDPTGEILRDLSGRKFRERVSKAFPFPAKDLTPIEIKKLCRILWPETRIELPPRRGIGKEPFHKEVACLDGEQERAALRLGPGHRMIKGPPGTGKTLVLVHRCCHLHKYRRRAGGILLVCYNIALVGYLKRLIQEKGVGTGEGGVHVCHFYELCSRVLGEPVDFQNKDRDYYALVVQETLERIREGKSRIGPFDAVLVDEAQDLDEEMLKVFPALLNPGGDLVLCMDSYQALYGKRPRWKGLGILTGGRTLHLRNAYRNTVEIFEFTQRFIGREPGSRKKESAMLPLAFGLHGEKPSLRRFQGMEEVKDFVLRDILSVTRKGEYKRSEIAILYDDKVYGPDGFAYDNRDLPGDLLVRLDASGIPASWVSQDLRAKQLYDITTDRVSIISIHSSKGLDYDLVYLIGIDHIRLADAPWQKLISPVYVAMTRAKYRLVIPYSTVTGLIEHMSRCL